MATHNKFTSNDTITGDKFQQQGNNNKMSLNHSKESKTKLIIGLVVAPLVVGLILLGAEYFGFMNLNLPFGNTSQGVSQPTPTPAVEQAIKDGCTRTTRLENPPQYDRALSLINQRISDHEKWCDKYCTDKDSEEKLRFKQFPANLTNCIKIVEDDIDDGEGYFVFHSENIKPNYFPITIDDSYNYADDTLTSLLITHEMTHVQQYLDSLNDTDNLSCRDKEVEAFISQADYYVLLSNEEISSVVLKMNEERDNKHPQIAMLKTMIDVNRDGTCPLFTDEECSQKHLRSELFKLVTENSSYHHQCKL